MELVADSIEDLWVNAAKALITKGQTFSPRGLKTREIVGMQLTLTNPRRRIPHLPVRKFSLAYAMGELAWYMGGKDDLDFIKYYAPSYGRYSDDGKRLHGAYGPRIFKSDYVAEENSQWTKVKQILQKDPDSRQAVIPIYSADDTGLNTKDMPCTLSLQFLIRNSQLNMLVNMRSNDLWLGGLIDVFCFTALQELMALELNLPLGIYQHHVGSYHMYERNFEDVVQVLEQHDSVVSMAGLAPRIPQGARIDDLLLRENAIRIGDPKELVEELCASLQDFGHQPSLWQLGYAAWRWRRISQSVEVKEDVRRACRGLLQDMIGNTFDRCFH